MSWAYSFASTAERAFKQLDRQARSGIIRYLEERIATSDDPTRFGKPLRGELHGYWRYRVGDYRIVCSVDRGQLLVLVVKVGHRSSIYD